MWILSSEGVGFFGGKLFFFGPSKCNTKRHGQVNEIKLEDEKSQPDREGFCLLVNETRRKRSNKRT